MTGDGSQFWLRTLGDLALYRSGEDEPCLSNSKALGLVAYLSLTPDRRARRPYLARLFWPDADREHRLRSLRQALYYLTDRAGRDLFLRDDGVLALRTGRLDVDLWAFDRALEAGDFERVAELYGGSFLGGFNGDVSREFLHWREAETERIWSGLKLAYRSLVEQELEAGDPEAAVDHARRYRDLNPLDEKARRLMIHALVADGRHVEAYQEYQQYATLLEEELGDAPSEELETRAREVREPLIQDRVNGSETGPEDDAEPPAPADVAAGGSTVRYAAGVAAALLAAGLLWTWWGGAAGGASTGAFRTVSADVDIVRRGSPHSWTVQLRRGRSAGVTGQPLREPTTPRPGHPGQAAVTIRSASGLDLGLADVGGSGDTARLTRRPYDEHPLDFSPDGRHVLYSFGVEAREGERYDLYGGILDPETGRRRLLDTGPARNVRSGDWSPYGPRIALAGSPIDGDLDIWVLPYRGARARGVTTHPARDDDPAWSPEESWIAFTSHRTGNPEIFLVRPDGSKLRQITRHPGADRSPVWISRDHLAFVSERNGGSDLWGFYLPTGERRRLTSLGDVREATAVDLRVPGRWIDSVRIRARRARVVPGEYLALRAMVFDSRGRRHPESNARVRWSFSDSARLSPAAGRGLYRVRGGESGPFEIRADVGGWRADTLTLRPASLARREAAVLETERWSERAVPTRWLEFGDPTPAVRRTPAAPFARIVDPRGDEHFDSGLARRDALDLSGGKTLSFWARAQFTRSLYQAFELSVTEEMPRAGEPAWNDASGPVTLTVQSGERPFTIRMRGEKARIPLPVDPAEWHRYTLQIGPDGAAWALVDGQLLWRSTGRLDLESLSDVHLVLHGRSEDTEVLFGPVTVHDGARYRLGSLP